MLATDNTGGRKIRQFSKVSVNGCVINSYCSTNTDVVDFEKKN